MDYEFFSDIDYETFSETLGPDIHDLMDADEDFHQRVSDCYVARPKVVVELQVKGKKIGSVSWDE